MYVLTVMVDHPLLTTNINILVFVGDLLLMSYGGETSERAKVYLSAYTETVSYTVALVLHSFLVV
jgi:hypothetical protein